MMLIYHAKFYSHLYSHAFTFNVSILNKSIDNPYKSFEELDKFTELQNHILYKQVYQEIGTQFYFS